MNSTESLPQKALKWWQRWCLRADPRPILAVAGLASLACLWEYRVPQVALVGLNPLFDFCFGLFFLCGLSVARGVQVLVRNGYESQLKVGRVHRSKRRFWTWLVVISINTAVLVQLQLPMKIGFAVSRPFFDAAAAAALAEPANSNEFAGRWLGFYEIAGVEVIGQTVIIYLGKDKGTYGFARVPGARSDLIARPRDGRQSDDANHHLDFPAHGLDTQGRRLMNDWYVVFSSYWLVKIGWS